MAWRDSVCPRGSITISLAPRLAAFLMKVAATGWLTVGLAPITMMTSASIAAANGADTAPELRPSNSAATEEAWQSRVQWSTLLEPKPVRTSFWNRYASSFEPLAEPKPASALTPFSSRIFDEALGGDVERLFPGRFAEMGEGIGRIDLVVGILLRIRQPHQRLGQAVRMVDVVEAEAALDAEPIVVGRAVAALGIDHLLVLDLIGDLAADAAERAERIDLRGRHR